MEPCDDCARGCVKGRASPIDWSDERGTRRPSSCQSSLLYYHPDLDPSPQESFSVSTIGHHGAKEVADRLVAQPGTKEYGTLSVWAQYFADVKQVFTVPRHVFIPQPKVDSSVVRFDLLDPPSIQVVNEPFFFQLVRASFAKRRKTLVNALYAAYSSIWSKDEIKELLLAAQIEPQRRGESCSLEDFARITEVFFDSFPQHQRVQLGG